MQFMRKCIHHSHGAIKVVILLALSNVGVVRSHRRIIRDMHKLFGCIYDAKKYVYEDWAKDEKKSSTQRGGRTHNLEIKSLTLYRLS